MTGEAGSKFKSSSVIVISGLVISMVGGGLTAILKYNELVSDNLENKLSSDRWQRDIESLVTQHQAFIENNPIGELVKFQREDFPPWRAQVENSVLTMETQLENLASESERNYEARRAQEVGEIGRIKDHERRDRAIEANNEKIDSEVEKVQRQIRDLHKWRETLSVGRIEILVDELSKLRQSFEKVAKDQGGSP